MVAQQFNGKKIVDEVSGWLRLLDDGSVDRTWTGPASALPLMEPVPPYSYSINGVTVHDIPGDPALRLYLPKSETPLPILLHFQGGGFCISHPSWLMYHQFYSRLARSVPAIIVSVVLPLAPEHRLPAAVDAAFLALICLEDVHLLRSSADFSRVFLIGDSSGGNLVHAVAARAAAPPIAGGIMLHPGFVRASRSRSEIELKSDSAFLTLDMLDKFLALSLPVGSTKDHPITCPMGEAAPPLEVLSLPPMMVAVAERDLIRDTNFEYCEAMKKAGKEVEVVVSKGVGHSFYLNKLAVEFDTTIGERTDELIDAITSFVKRH